MTDFERTNKAVADLAALKFFPSNNAARLAVVRVVRDMATSDDQVAWLIRRALQVFDSWEGPREIRALFCSRYRPRDGIEATSTVYPEGFPSEKRPEPRKVEPLPGVVSLDDDFDAALRQLAGQKGIQGVK